MPTLRELRLRRYLSQAELAERVGVTEVTIHSWETGKRVPRLGNLRRLAEALGVKVETVGQAVDWPARQQGKGKAVA